MPFPCLPKFRRCCWCTKKLKVACVLIAMWSMLAICHSSGILLWPACPPTQSDGSNPYQKPLKITMFMLFPLNIITASCSFGYLLALFLDDYLYFGELFVIFGFLSAMCMFAHAVLVLIVIFQENSQCTNPSDAIAHIIYCIVWCYFICIVNSYSYEMRR